MPRDQYKADAKMQQQAYSNYQIALEHFCSWLTAIGSDKKERNDGFDRIRRTDGMMLGFICFDECRQHEIAERGRGSFDPDEVHP